MDAILIRWIGLQRDDDPSARVDGKGVKTFLPGTAKDYFIADWEILETFHVSTTTKFLPGRKSLITIMLWN
jgi:hypothetical protein